MADAPTSSAPIEVGRVALTVNDLAGVARFYEAVLGLRRFGEEDATIALGAGDRVLMELRGDPAAPRPSRREAGLFHTAFLLPSRPDLGAWLRHVGESGVRLQGASDHLVSEAIYLADPEGNGIEVYRDRPRAEWPMEGLRVRMASDPLDLDEVAGSADGPWAGAPVGTVIGHVHLQVGDVAEAERFYGGLLGLDVMAHYPGASFLSSGGYHHHLGANVWNSAGAGRRTPGARGLAEVVLAADAGLAATLSGRLGAEAADPWGTRITVEPKAG